MDNNITNINEMSQEQIMEAIGQDDGSSKGAVSYTHLTLPTILLV